MMKVFFMTKCVKNIFFAKKCYILSNNVPIKKCFLGGRLIQAPNMSNHISRNGGATIKAFRKTAHDKVFILGQKGNFCTKNGGTIKRKL